jgi:DNA-directed RNA polymerase specialized sigma24 family protein
MTATDNTNDLTIDTTDTTLAPSAAPSSNDNGSVAATPDTTKLAVERSLRGVIRGTLVRKGRLFEGIDDDIQEVLTRAIAYARTTRMPADVDGWKALCALVAERYAIDEGIELEARSRYDTGLCEEPDEYGPVQRVNARDPIDTKRYMEVLIGQFEAGDMPAKGAEILMGVADGLTYKEIAEETELTERKVRYRMEKMRETYFAKLTKLGLLVVLAFIAVPFASVAVNEGGSGPEVGAGRPEDEGVVRLVTREERARELREQAMKACEHADWTSCLSRLDEAQSLDPAGEEAPEVAAARRLAQEGARRQLIHR